MLDTATTKLDLSNISWFENIFAQQVWEKKYAGKHNSVKDFFKTIASAVSSSEPQYYEPFLDLLISKKFSPGGRILAGLGGTSNKSSLMNCTTHSIEGDTIEDISLALKRVMRASSRGQGIGIDLSKLRPLNAPVDNAAITSTGAISFMELINHAGGIIGQEGRRSALLFSMRDNHPDLWRPHEKDKTCPKCGGKGCMRCHGTGMFQYDFLNIKRFPGKVENANISVLISNKFMQAVKNNDLWELKFSGNSGGVDFLDSRIVRAQELFSAIAYAAWESAEPGVLFEDNARVTSNSDLFGDEWKIVGVNACTEQLLDQEGVCNLGSLNLAAYVEEPFTKNAHFNMEIYKRDIALAIRFLDNVIDLEIARNTAISNVQLFSLLSLRRVGLGVMGFADMLAMLGHPYNLSSTDTDRFVQTIFSELRDTAYRMSVGLAAQKGAAPVWRNAGDYVSSIVNKGFFDTLPEDIKRGIEAFGTRNVTLLSIAPTGSISNLLGTSSGIEPVYATQYTRRFRLNGHEEFVDYVHPAALLGLQFGKDLSTWETAYTITPHEHIIMQATIQDYIDQSISKTTNMPEETTPMDIEELYTRAHEYGLKGLAVYRDGSRDKQILYTEDKCPICEDGGKIIYDSGCKSCSACGWSVCT